MDEGEEGRVEYVVCPAPGSLFDADPFDPIEAAIISVPKFVAHNWTYLREHPCETKRDVFLRMCNEIERGPAGDLIAVTMHGVCRRADLQGGGK